MVTNTTMNTQNTSQRCCSHCSSVHTNTSSKGFRKTEPPTVEVTGTPPNFKQPKSNAASNTCGPSDATRIPRDIKTHLKPDTTSNIFQQQVSHFTTYNTVCSLETSLVTDATIDGQTSFHRTLQVITSQGSKPLHVKGAECSSIPCPISTKHFPNTSQSLESLKPMWMIWSAHDGACQNFLGYILLDIQHKILSQVLPCKFYIFEDSTSPDILLSYHASSRLGIVQYTVPNKAPINYPSMIDTIKNSKTVTSLVIPSKTFLWSLRIKIQSLKEVGSYTDSNVEG